MSFVSMSAATLSVERVLRLFPHLETAVHGLFVWCPEEEIWNNTVWWRVGHIYFATSWYYTTTLV